MYQQRRRFVKRSEFRHCLLYNIYINLRNLQIAKWSLLIKPIKVFKHLKLISIKTRIFKVALNIFLFSNGKNSNARIFPNSYGLK